MKLERYCRPLSIRNKSRTKRQLRIELLSSDYDLFLAELVDLILFRIKTTRFIIAKKLKFYLAIK